MTTFRRLYSLCVNAVSRAGGDKTGNDRFYAQMIPIADALYDVHLEELKAEQAKENKLAEEGKKAKKAKTKECGDLYGAVRSLIR